MTVLVTGGARRIGRAIVNALAAGGWRVLVHSRLPGDPDAESLAREVGGVALSADLSDPLGPASLFNAAVEAAPDISALVNNAALFSAAGELPPDELAAMESVNVEAPRKLATMLAMRLGTNEEGCHALSAGRLPVRGAVVNLLDSRVLACEPRTPYARTKADMMASQMKLAGLMSPYVRVNFVAPGPVLPPTRGGRVRGGEMLLDSRPTPEDVASAVAYLLSARSVTGAVLPVDSGQSLLDALEQGRIPAEPAQNKRGGK